jgi:hypothetical protein
MLGESESLSSAIACHSSKDVSGPCTMVFMAQRVRVETPAHKKADREARV